MRIGQLVQRAVTRGERSLRVWRPGWPDTAYLEVRFNERGVVDPVGRAILEDAEGNRVDEKPVPMLYAPMENDYEEF